MYLWPQRAPTLTEAGCHPRQGAVGPLEIWFQDEARVRQKGGHAYIRAPIGSRPQMVRDNRHVSTYIFGAIRPERAVGAAMIMPYATTYAMNKHLAKISAEVAPGAHAILVCDGAGWHQRGQTARCPRQHHAAVLAA